MVETWTKTLLIRNTRAWVQCSDTLGHDNALIISAGVSQPKAKLGWSGSQFGSSVVSVPALPLCGPRFDTQTGALHVDWVFQSLPDYMGFPYRGFLSASKTEIVFFTQSWFDVSIRMLWRLYNSDSEVWDLHSVFESLTFYCSGLRRSRASAWYGECWWLYFSSLYAHCPQNSPRALQQWTTKHHSDRWTGISAFQTVGFLAAHVGNLYGDTRWLQTYQVKSIVLGNVLMLWTTKATEIFLVSLLPPSVPKSPIGKTVIVCLNVILLGIHFQVKFEQVSPIQPSGCGVLLLLWLIFSRIPLWGPGLTKIFLVVFIVPLCNRHQIGYSIELINCVVNLFHASSLDTHFRANSETLLKNPG